MDAALRSGIPIGEAARLGAFGSWADAEEARDSFEYVRRPTGARFYFWKPVESIWSRVFDAVFFTDVVYPSTRAADPR